MDTKDYSDKRKQSVVAMVSPLGVGANELSIGKSFSVDIPIDGVHQFALSYANGHSQSHALTVTIDGKEPQLVELQPTGSWAAYSTAVVSLDLKAGARILSLTSLNNSGAEIASLTHLGAVGGRTLGSYLTSGALAGLNVAAVGAVALTLSPSVQNASEPPHPDPRDEPSSTEAPREGPQHESAAPTPMQPSPVAAADEADPSTPNEAEAGLTTGSVPEEEEAGGKRQVRFLATAEPSVSSRADIVVDIATPELNFEAVEAVEAPAPRAQPMSSQATSQEDPAQALDVPPQTDLDEQTPDDITPAVPEPALPEPPAAAQVPLRLEAESAVRGNLGTGTTTDEPSAVSLDTAATGDIPNADAASGDAYLDFSGVGSNHNIGSGQYVEWTFDVAEGGYYDLAFGYAFFSNGATNRPMRLDVNGQVWDRIFDFASTGANTTYSEATTRVLLEAGVNTVRLTANGFSGPNLDYLEIRPPHAGKIVIQAESLLNPAVATAPTTENRLITLDYLEGKPTAELFRVGAEGDAYLDWAGGTASQTLIVPVTAAVAGSYQITITYANGGAAPRPLELRDADGQVLGTFNFPPTAAPGAYPEFYDDISARVRPSDGNDAGTAPDPTGFEGWRAETLTVSVELQAGQNILTLVGANGPNLDKIEFNLVSPGEPEETNTAPTAEDRSASTNEDNLIVIDVADLIDDADDDSLTVTASVPAAQGSVVVSGTQIVFTPAPHFHGPASITYVVSDGTASATATVLVNVAPVNDAPALAGDLDDQDLPASGGTVALDVLTFVDVDGDAVTLGARLAGGGSLPEGITIVGGALAVAEDVPAGSYEIEIFATDGILQSQPVTFTVAKAAPAAEPEPFSPYVLQAEDGVVIDQIDNVAAPANDTQIRDADNPESPGGKVLDASGLRPGSTGTGYVDFGSNTGSAGDSLTLNFEVATAGTYTLHFRYANGGTAPRPLALSVNDSSEGTLNFAHAQGTADPWSHWMLQTVSVNLSAGPNSVVLSIPGNSLNGPNIDAVAITQPGGTPSFFMPVITSAAIASIVENTTSVLDVNAVDGDGAALTYSLTGNGAHDALFQIDPVTGALNFQESPDFEAAAGGDTTYQVEVAVGDGTSTVTQLITVSVTDVNEAPEELSVTGGLSLAENAQAGTVIGTVAATDPDGNVLSYTVSDDRFVVDAGGQIIVAEGASFDFEAEASIQLQVTASDGELSTAETVTIAVIDVAEQVAPRNVVFDAATLTSYSTQDRGAGASVADEGATLHLDGNLWKRAPIGGDYVITTGTKLVATVTIGDTLPEILAIGFDDDDSPFEMSDGSVYQIGGSQGQAGFIDLRNGAGSPGQTIQVAIDLSAHAGKTISSLVFIADDDYAGDGIGSVSFKNVQLLDGDAAGESNNAPDVLAGGIADVTLPERGPLEIDLPFIDRDGDNLTYTVTVVDALGNPMPSFAGLQIVEGSLVGQLDVAPGNYLVTVTASDGQAQTSDSFQLTVEDVNDAPVVDANAAFEPFFGKVGQEIEGIDLYLFADAFSDADNEQLVLSVEGLPAGLSLNEEGVIVGTPREAASIITIVATDPHGARAELQLPFLIAGPTVGDVITVEAEAFTGLGQASGFYAAAAPGASGNQAIRTNPSQAGSISTNLSQNGIVEGWYEVTITVYDETDGTARFSLKIGDTVLAQNLAFDEAGTFDNPSLARGNAGQAGNLKTITFTTAVFVDADAVAQITGQSDAGEYLRIDKLTFTQVEAPEIAPSAVSLDPNLVNENAAGAVIGTLSATDPDGDTSALTYSTTDARFVIEGDQIRLADGVSLDHEAAETVAVTVMVTDAQGLQTTTDLTIAVGDVNEAPVLLDGTEIADVSFVSGAGGSIDLAPLAFTDPDANAELTVVARLADGSGLPEGFTLEDGQLQIADSVAAGVYTLEVFASDGDLESNSVSFTVTVTEPGAEPEEPFSLLIQAESGLVTSFDTDSNNTDTAIRDADNPETGNNASLIDGLRPGFTGTGYLDYGDTAGDRAAYTFEVPAAGAYEIKVRYATNTARPLDLVVNGAAPVQMAFVATGTNSQGPAEGFNNWGFETITVQLQAGSNTISFAIPAGANTGPNLDSFEITRILNSGDVSADEDGNLFLSGPDGVLTGANKDSINFNIAGRDADIVKVEVSFDGGDTRVTVLPDADGDFVVDGSGLATGSYQATVYVTDEAGNEASTSMPIQVGGDVVPPFLFEIEGEELDVSDVEATPGTPADTVGRTPDNNEPQATSANSGAGLAFDEFGLRPGYEGAGYLDMGNDVGDSASFSLEAPSAGTYQLTIRYANGGTTTRPMTVDVGGREYTVDLPSTIPPGGTVDQGWSSWAEVTIDVELAAGSNTIAFSNTIANGPNIDNITVSRDGSEPVDTREQIRFEEIIKINFEPAPGSGQFAPPAGYQTPSGYVADTGAGYGDRDNGFTYGWVDVEGGTVTHNALAQPDGSMRYKDDVAEASNLQKTYAHFEYPGASAATNERAWEMALEDGTYQLTMSIGDTGGAYDSNYVINVEGQSFMPGFTPANLEGQSPTGSAYNSAQDGEGFRSTLVTGIVTVTDGRLTIDSIGGYNTEIQYLEIEKIPDLTPDDGRSADLDFSLFAAPMADSLDGQVPISIGEDGSLPTGIDPSSSFVVAVQLQADGNRGPNIAHVENIKLVETLTGVEVEIDVQISGGADSLTIRPLEQLKENTSYTLKVQDVMDLGSITDPNGALRQFQDLTTTFVTGEAQEDVPREVAFSTQTLPNGFADGAGGYTAIEFGPDGKLYVATITGEIHRWDVNADGTINKASQETLSHDYLDVGNGERRGIVGFVFDPEDPNTIWITDNAPIPRESKAFDTPEFSGRVSKITLGDGGSFEGVQAETYIWGLPRSGGDHLTNSLEFRANPNAGQAGEPDYLLYLSQGSNSAAGAPDAAWGSRPERLLNAAILEIDPTRTAPNGGFDVRTEPVDLEDVPTTTFPASQFNDDGTYPGSYNPFAADAVLKIYATGVRNAYDLVWHSNGHLYVPTNGTASGGKTPQDPTQPGLDTVISNSPKQYDYFFTVEEGKYYGHPNVLRDEYVLNGGNPTSGLDPNEVVGGNDGNRNTDGYQTGVETDENYDLDGVYNLGYNRSPNGAIEYTGNAFGSNLKGAILFAQFSTGDNVRMIRVDAEGNIIGDDVLRRPDGSVIDDYIDPLDIIQNPVTGQLYLMTLNRGTGASQLILLTPAPGGVTADLTADEGGNLALVALDVSDPLAAVFQVNGLDSDITAIRVSFNGGPETTVTLDGQNRFTVNLDGLTGPVTARIRVTDDALNEAATTVQFTPGDEPTTPQYVTLVTIQAEDRTPGDGTSVTVPTGSNAQIQIRDAFNRETGSGVNGEGYVDALRPGAYGTDGNTDNLDGTPGGYADFGSTNADYLTFTFAADNAGSAILKFRYSNGAAADRPLQLEVNGSIVKLQSFAPTATGPDVDGWTLWSEVEIPVTLAAGQNTVTLRSVSATGPNIDQLVVLVPAEEETVPNDGEVVVDGVAYLRYEAENAELGGAPAVVSEDRDQSGDFVDFLGPDSETITWTVEVGAAGTYGIDILYALGAGKVARPMTVSVNGQVFETLPFAANSNTAETVWGAQSASLQLAAGVNTITLTAPGGVGPNVDQLRITKEPVAVFEPDYVDIAGSGRIELETQGGSAQTINGSTVEFFFTVDANGVYKLDTAANANAANGQGLTWFLNGVEVDESAFPGTGTAGEQSVYLELEAGTQYRMRIVSDAPGASALDYLDISPAPGNANADIGVQSLDPAYFENRLHFSYLENPDAVDPDAPDRDFKDTGTVRISNTGTEPLSFIDYELDGPFTLADPSIFEGLVLAPGQAIDVTVLFNRAAYTPPTSNIDGTSTVFTGKLEVITNDADDPVTTIDLAGFWQARDEGGHEPNVNEVWKIFGFGNVIDGLRLTGGGENSALSTNDVFAKTDETEVLSPYWKLADGVSEARITHIAAFHGTGGATVHIHNPGNKGQNVLLWNHEGVDNQRLLPNAGNDTSYATTTIGNGRIPDNWVGNEVFGISVAGLSTDPRLNPRGDVLVQGAQQGHTVKMFQALDADGNVIPNVYLGIMDYTGINYDYNDNMFVIEGVEPVGFGQDLRVSGLDDAAADDRLVFTNIDQPANTQQAFRNEATFTISNDGFAPLNISSVILADPANFQIVGNVPSTIAAGASAQITVRFIGTHSGTSSGADLFKSTLTITSDDFSDAVKVIQLAGLAQEFSENNSEPTVAQIVEAFGYSTDIAQGELAGGGVVETVGDEVLLPYLQRLDNSRPVEVIQIAAFLNQGNVARLGFHGLNSSTVTNLFANDDQQGQTVLPDQLVSGGGAGAAVARGTINQNGPFGIYISVDGRPTYSSWSDPEANKIDPNFGHLVGDSQGHLIRYFQALDAEGNVIEGTYIGIQDYPGAGNYDYNDHMFVIKNVKPYELTAANDANGDDINDALQLDGDNDGTVNFFDPNTTPQEPEEPEEPGGENRGDYVFGINFGGGAIANDPVLGVALAAQNDPRVTIAGSVNPGAGTDDQGNPNGANATSGSAFKTYEDGSNWTATIQVPNGTYVVVLHTQETYWNTAGMRQFDAFINGQQVINNLDPFAAAGGDDPIAVEAVVTVTNGQISINMVADIDNAALNAVTIYEYAAPGSAQQPLLGTPFLVDGDGITIDASNYDNGGQGVAYNDQAGLQGGNNGGRAGSDVEQTSSGDIGWIQNGEWLEYTVSVETAGAYNLALMLANGGGAGRSATVSFYRDGEATPYVTKVIDNPQMASWSTFTSRSNGTVGLEAGEQVMRVSFSGGSQDYRSVSLTPVAPAQTPYGGAAPSFANGVLTVDASNFDEGGQGVAYNDNPGLDGGVAATSFRPGRAVELVGSGMDVGHVKPGEWVEYTINVPAAGVYSFTANAKTPVTGANIAVSLNGTTPLGTVTLADGHAGGANFSSAAFAQSGAIQLSLGAGVQTLRLTFDGPLASNGYVLDLASFTLVAQPTQQPVGGIAPVLDVEGLTIEALDYDEGGQGVAYNDAAGLQGGTNGGRAGSSVEVTSGGNVGWIGNGEWLEYTINVEEAGSYELSLSMAVGESGGPNRSVSVSFTNGSQIDEVTVETPRTGTWSNFQETDTVVVDLDAGITVVRLTFSGGAQDISSFTLNPVSSSVAAAMLVSAADEPAALVPPETKVVPDFVPDAEEIDASAIHVSNFDLMM
ncbi:hypothetical protein REJC140_03028 [Pseudorhizobium endolithicum]|uniref:Uncharacterized protein n=1 Tax=Pseudorhizobium endolithicum TaxID=1191678 RepID=A0ABN7JMW1_9HYPH|nr:carbohydrate-binding protein [Pseudorhizobium endolithicum]CAD7032253.1 hypothetical protein REJC140_03028 [Pseudorhizobium endolithicum]